MNASELRQGIALRLDDDARIVDVFVDAFDLTIDALGMPFGTIVDSGSEEKADRFIAQIHKRGEAYDWELIVSGTTVLTFSGRRNEVGIIVIGGRTEKDIERMYEDLLRINNEQANSVRDLAQQVSMSRRDTAKATNAVDGLMALNNELATVQRELARKNAELARVNEQMNEMVGMVAHDLRNPLGVVTGYAQVLLDGVAGDLSPEQRRFLSRVAKSGALMRSIVDELVDLAAVQSGHVRLDLLPVDLRQMVVDVVEMSAFIGGEKHIEVVLAPGPAPSVLADAGKLRQVIDNLLSNAIKYSHQSTTVTVRIDVSGEFAVLEVHDQGQGIPASELGTLFNPFTRGSTKTTGGEQSTGLGLAIARRIVDAHGGRIEVESEVGEGSTFRVWLPLG